MIRIHFTDSELEVVKAIDRSGVTQKILKDVGILIVANYDIIAINTMILASPSQTMT
jgi:hypothetical protein